MKVKTVDRPSYISEYEAFLRDGMWPFVDAFLDKFAEVSCQNRIFLAGNGASAAVASHLANDFTKALGWRAQTFHDPALITCLSNDYGYDQWIAKAVDSFASKDDFLILISSSGRSANIVQAANSAVRRGVKVVSLTGPTPSHDLVTMSDIHLKVNSRSYNVIECCHMMALCAVVDSLNLVKL